MSSIRRRRSCLIALALASLGWACGGVVLPDDSRPAAITIVSGDAQSAPAGGELAQPLVVRVADGSGRPVEGQAVTFAVDAGGGTITPTSATTGSDGEASASWTLGGGAGQQTVHAQVTGDGVPASLVVSFTATAATGAGADLVIASGDNQTAAVGSALPESLVVKVTDTQGNPVAGVDVHWSVSGGGSVSPETVTSGADGLAAAQRVLGNTSGSQTAQAGSDGLPTVTFTSTAEPANPTSLLLISGDGQSAPAGSALADSLTVRLVDDNGNGVGGKPITWVVAPGSGTVSPVNVTTSPTGIAQTSWTLGPNAGPNQLTAVFSGVPSVPFTGTGTSGSAVKLAFIVPPVNTAAGSPIAPAVKVAFQDATGNTVASVNDAVTLAIGTNPAGGTLSGTVTVGAVNGVATFPNLSIDKAGNGYTLTASSGAFPAVTSTTFDILTGSANHLVFLVGPTDRVVGQKFLPGLQVQVQDAGGNPVLAATGTITLISSVTGTLKGQATATPVLGTATFNNLAVDSAGTGYTLTALASGVTSVTSDGFNVAQATTTIVITSQSSGTSVVGQPVTFNYDIDISPPGAGPITGTVTVSDGNDSCEGPINLGFGTGHCDIAFTSPGPKNVTATYSGDVNLLGSTTSTAKLHTVNKANTTLSIESDDPDPSAPGGTVTVQWSLAVSAPGAGTPTGDVTVTVDGVQGCNAPVEVGSCQLTIGATTDHLKASYSGDGNFNGSLSKDEHHNVSAPNQPPTAVDDPSYTTVEDQALSVSMGNGVLKNDSDLDHGPQSLTARNASDPAHGAVSLGSDGSFTYTPDADFNGPDTFTYEAFDGAAASTATVTVTVSAVNDAPSFTSGSSEVSWPAASGSYSQPWATGISAGPPDESGQTLTFVTSTDVAGALLFSSPPSIDVNGTLTFTPNGSTGSATVTVRLQDNGGTANGGSDRTTDQTFQVTIN